MRIKITVQKIAEDKYDSKENNSITLDVSGEIDVCGWIEHFKVILDFIGYHANSVDEIFIEDE